MEIGVDEQLMDETQDLEVDNKIIPLETDNKIEDNSIVTIEENKTENEEIIPEENSNDVKVVCCHDFTAYPLQVTGAWKEFGKSEGNFTRGCKWSPDGSCLLSNSNDNCIRIFNLPEKLWQMTVDWETIEELLSVLSIQESELIYDYCWYPLMSSFDPLTCCFAAVSRDNPVHMWDAFTGQLRCSYRPYNHADEIVAPHSLAFDLFGEKLYCGFNKTIRIFDVCKPGRDCVEKPTNTKRQGQAGIISCFAFNPTNDLYAAGSYCKTVGMYSTQEKDMLYLLSGQLGGVTHLIFSPDGKKLFSGGRKDCEILCWDIRNPGKVLHSMRRLVTTNQRMYFDLSSSGQHLISGNHNGVITVWDLDKQAQDVLGEEEPILQPILFFQAHNDCVNGVSIHPSLPLLMTSSGQRQFPEPEDSESSDSEVQNDDKCDNSLRLWWTGGSQCISTQSTS